MYYVLFCVMYGFQTVSYIMFMWVIESAKPWKWHLYMFTYDFTAFSYFHCMIHGSTALFVIWFLDDKGTLPWCTPFYHHFNGAPWTLLAVLSNTVTPYWFQRTMEAWRGFVVPSSWQRGLVPFGDRNATWSTEPPDSPVTAHWGAFNLPHSSSITRWQHRRQRLCLHAHSVQSLTRLLQRYQFISFLAPGTNKGPFSR